MLITRKNILKKIIILVESPTQGLDDTKLTAEKNIQLVLKSFKHFV